MGDGVCVLCVDVFLQPLKGVAGSGVQVRVDCDRCVRGRVDLVGPGTWVYEWHEHVWALGQAFAWRMGSM